MGEYNYGITEDMALTKDDSRKMSVGLQELGMSIIMGLIHRSG